MRKNLNIKLKLKVQKEENGKLLPTCCRRELISFLDVSRGAWRRPWQVKPAALNEKPLPNVAVKGSTQSILLKPLSAGKKRSALLSHFVVN